MDLLKLVEFLTIITKAYLSLYLILTLLKEDVSLLRLTISSLIIGIYLFYKNSIVNDNFILSVIIATISILIAKKEYTFWEYFKISFLFFVVEILAKGMEYMLVKVINPNELLSELIVCFSILLASFALKSTIFLLSISKKRTSAYKVVLESEGRCFKTKGFFDSGNMLYYKKIPVIIISNKISEKLALKPDRKIVVNTISGNATLMGGELSLKIFSDKKSHKILRVCYGISDTINSRGYEVILHRDMEIL